MVVLDASAVLAYFRREAGFEQVDEVLESGGVMSAVNFAEVLDKSIAYGADVGAVAARLRALRLRIEPFGSDDAAATAALYSPTRSSGLSLGDRACLALAHRLQVPALTADRAWSALTVGVEVRLIR